MIVDKINNEIMKLKTNMARPEVSNFDGILKF